MGLASLFGFVEASHTQESPVTAIDILLEPDATMVQHAHADNARLLKAYPGGFALDPTHQPHLTLIQRFVRTADLDKVYAAANHVLANEKAASWNLKAFKYYYIPVPPNGIAGIVVETTEELLRLQQELLDAVAPFTEKTGTTAAFVSADGGLDIQPGLIDYVADFSTVAAGKKFNPHVTIGVAPEVYLDEMLAEPFKPFTFSPVGASVYQLGSFGAARKKLQALSLAP
jgi:2'-5' RNA ligase